MKKLILIAALFFNHTLMFAGTDKDSTGMDGDHLDLTAVLDLFKLSNDIEAFEKSLNTESNKVNNLDLNRDGEIDYIRVFDKSEGNYHAIVLQVNIDEKESQDVAVIEIEKTDNEKAQLQIVGDEDLYGENYFIEPSESTDEKSPSLESPAVVIVNVWAWPSVRFIYGPNYRPYVSPWHWKHRPIWWKPWRPYSWRVYHSHVVLHHRHYRHVNMHRCVNAHKIYHPHRVHAAVVHNRAKAHPHYKARNANGKRANTPNNGGKQKANPRNGSAPRKAAPKKQGPRKK